ncbi:MAG: DUF6807 family protein [Gemmatimonadaceae bacterium]
MTRALARRMHLAVALSLAGMLACATGTRSTGRTTGARGVWERAEHSLAWKVGDSTRWRFSFDPKAGKPYFHPVSVGNGPSLTNFKPEDHPWHYALWFSWKYINHVNYWEENRVSGQAAGATRWSAPTIDARPDGSARITMQLTYTRPTGETDLTEARVLDVSAPAPDGSYTIDWSMRFTAGKDGAALDRTPMPGEPNGVINGGYAGLSARLAAAPATMTVVSTEGPVAEFRGDRARPNAAAVAGNFSLDGRDIGGIAILSDPANIAGQAPWYIIDNKRDFRFICAAILAPAVRTIPPNGALALRYRVALEPTAWTREALVEAMRRWQVAGK